MEEKEEEEVEEKKEEVEAGGQTRGGKPVPTECPHPANRRCIV